MSDITRILESLENGASADAERLAPILYDELRRLAAYLLTQEQPGHTLQATALVHEAYLRLVGSDRQWSGRRHFFCAAAQAMRRILIESARRKNRIRHGGGQERVGLDYIELPTAMPSEEREAMKIIHAFGRRWEDLPTIPLPLVLEADRVPTQHRRSMERLIESKEPTHNRTNCASRYGSGNELHSCRSCPQPRYSGAFHFSNVGRAVSILMLTASVLAGPVPGTAQPTPPQITIQPASEFVSMGARAIFRAVAVGTAPLSYQWRLNEIDLPGKTDPGLTIDNVQRADLGSYTVVVMNREGSVTSNAAVLEEGPAFVQVTTGPVVTVVDHSGDGAWGDYDGDGFLDLFVTNGNADLRAYDFLFHNNGDGSFTKVTSGPHAEMFVDSISPCWGDFDNDGALDLFVAVFGRRNAFGTNLLYRNRGGGRFTRITTGPMVTGVQDWGGVSWIDYDNDGFLDLFLTVWTDAATTRNYLYRNNGDGTFTEITDSVLVTDLGGLFAGFDWADYDNDGDADLFVPNSSKGRIRDNRFYRNNGDGTFTKVLGDSIVLEGGYSNGAAWGDYDNDGFFDLFVANGEAFFGGPRNNYLYHNNGDGTFTPVSHSIVANDGGTSWSGRWGDFDNDGFLDLFVGNVGFPLSSSFLYRNNGDGTFSKVTCKPTREPANTFNPSWTDFDNDGFLDLFMPMTAFRPSLLFRNNVRNTGNANHWLTLKPVGVVSNRSAIGAKVRVRAVIGGRPQWQLRQISGAAFGQGGLRAHFGLGTATSADVVRIEWPSGIVQELKDVPADRILTLNEPAKLRMIRPGELHIQCWQGQTVRIEHSRNLTTWTPRTPITNLNETGGANWTDPDPSEAVARYYRAVKVSDEDLIGP